MIKEDMKVHGAVTATLVRGNGDIEVTKKDNLIVTIGYDFICNSIANGTSRPTAMSHIEIGTGSTAPDASDTALEAPIVADGRIAATYNHVAGTKVFTMTATYAAGVATGRIVEAGVINNAVSGNGILFDRVTFNEINKGASDSLTVQFSFTLS